MTHLQETKVLDEGQISEIANTLLNYEFIKNNLHNFYPNTKPDRFDIRSPEETKDAFKFYVSQIIKASFNYAVPLIQGSRKSNYSKQNRIFDKAINQISNAQKELGKLDENIRKHFDYLGLNKNIDIALNELKMAQDESNNKIGLELSLLQSSLIRNWEEVAVNFGIEGEDLKKSIDIFVIKTMSLLPSPYCDTNGESIKKQVSRILEKKDELFLLNLPPEIRKKVLKNRQ